MKPHPGLGWRIFHILTIENTDGLFDPKTELENLRQSSLNLGHFLENLRKHSCSLRTIFGNMR